MDSRGPRYKSMLLERRIPQEGKKQEFDTLISARKKLVNDLRRCLKTNKDILVELELKIKQLEKEIETISYAE